MMLTVAPALSVGWFLLLALLAGCASPVVKREVFDAEVLARRPLPADLMSDAPGSVSDAQLAELHVKSTWEGE